MKKGFTLVELLAVIIVLAIILLIAIPIILNIISETRKGAFETSAMGLIKTASQEYMRRSITKEPGQTVVYYWSNGQQIVYPNNISKYPPLKYSGKDPENGYLKVYPNGDIEVRLTDGIWYVHEETGETKLGDAIAYDETIEDLLTKAMFEEIVSNIIEVAKEELERKKTYGINDTATYNFENDLQIVVLTDPEADLKNHPPLSLFPPNSPLSPWFPDEGYIIINPVSASAPETESEFKKRDWIHEYSDTVFGVSDACNGENKATIGDKVYSLTAIGTQCWMAENLNYDIHGAGTSWCYGENTNNCNNYGRLYTHEAATSIIVPGFVLPTDEDWQQLETTLGLENPNSLRWRDGGNIGQKLKTKQFGGLNLFGFKAIPSGWRYNDTTLSEHGGIWPWWDLGYTAKSAARYWTATSTDSGHAWGRMLSLEKTGIHRWAEDRGHGFSVRLLRTSGSRNDIIYNYKPYFETITLSGFTNIYTSVDQYQNPRGDCGAVDNFYSGNFQHHHCLASGASATRLNLQNNNSGHRVLAGTNNYVLASTPANGDSWLGISILGACYTRAATYSNLVLNFSDGDSANISQAIANKYISPLVIYGSSSSYSSYYFNNTQDILFGGGTDTKDFSNLHLFIKPMQKVLTSITMTSNVDSRLHSSCSDGFHIYEYPNFNFSPYGGEALTLDSPIIQVFKNEETVAKKNTFLENTVVAFDHIDGDLGDRVSIAGVLNYNIPEQYLLTYSVKNARGNEATTTKKINVIENPGYSDGINEFRSIIYTSNSKYDSEVADCGVYDNYYAGNYQRVNCLSQGSQINKLNLNNNNGHHRILSGVNTYNLKSAPIHNKNWLKIEFIGKCYTINNEYSNLLLNFSDGYSNHITNAIADGYIDPSVIYGSSMNNASYVFPTPQNILSGGGTGNRSFADLVLYIKPIEKTLVSITLTAALPSRLHSSCNDGFAAYELLNFEFSVFNRETLRIQKPYITISKPTPEVITVGTNYIERNLFAFDYQDFNITQNINSTTSFNKNVVGLYNVLYSITDSDGNSALPISKSVEVILKGTYEYNLQTTLPALYNTLDKFTSPINCNNETTHFHGNYRYGMCLVNGANTHRLNKETNNYRDKIIAGTNTYQLARPPLDNSNWLMLLLYGACFTNTNHYSDLKLNFSDGYSGFINEAIANNYIDGFVIYGSSRSSASYLFPTPFNVLFGGSTGSGAYANFHVYIKPKNKVLDGVSFFSNRASGIHSACSDGLDVIELVNYDISTTN